uniref:Ig-like domain-containing protein n=1 Tax=Kryptolebias marmoratus TaxID=37003 RepID=A0A3Q3B6D7_KRYMA
MHTYSPQCKVGKLTSNTGKYLNYLVGLSKSKTISQKVGDEVILNCTNTTVNIVTWKMNGHLLIALKLENKTFHKNEKANRLDVEMLSTKSQLYALVIKNTQKSHEGNYTCEMTTDSGLFEKKWELHVTGLSVQKPASLIVWGCIIYSHAGNIFFREGLTYFSKTMPNSIHYSRIAL